jgi:LemA protein
LDADRQMTRSQWLILSGTAAVALFWILGAHNRVVMLRNAIHGAWVPLDELLLQREKALLALVDCLLPLLASELGTLDAARAAQNQHRACLDAARRRPSQADSMAGLGTAESVLQPLLARVLALADHDSALAARSDVAAAMRDLREFEPGVGFARQAFNSACANYNAAIQQFPTRLLSSMLGFAEAGTL